MKQTRLGKQDWIEAGFRALVARGAEGLRVEAIARDLGVSKGSFYWHFRDAGALRTAMLAHWAEVATGDVITEITAQDTPPEERLRALIRRATTPPDATYGGAGAEAAVRHWARYDAAARAVVETVDRQRIAFTAALLQDCGFAQSDAQQLALALYSALVGGETLAGHCDGDPGAALQILLDTVLRVRERG